MKLILPILVMLSLFASSLPAAQDPAEVVRKFKESLKTVDRLVLERTDFGRPKDKDLPKIVLEIKGTDLIASLGDTIEIKKFEGECLCYETPEMHFYRGESYLFSMTLHHSHRLRGRDSVWGGDAVLTDQSAEKFRAWFAQRGYDGFVNGNTERLQAIAEEQARQDKFLEIFPEPVRKLFPNKEDRYDRKARQQQTERISAYYPNRTTLVLDCWRGLGEYSLSISGGSWESTYQGFIRNMLDSIEVSELRSALEVLPVEEDRVSVGAFRYYEYPGSRRKEEMALAFSDESLARVAKRALPLTRDYESQLIVKRLAERPGAATNGFLLEIAQTGMLDMPKKYSDGTLIAHPRLPIAVSALLALAKNTVVDCRPVIVRRLTETSDPEVQLALEVALAQFEGPGSIKPAHFQSRFYEVAELAWETLARDPRAQFSIETLASLATKSESHRVRDDATKKLQAFGLRVMSDAEKAAAILAEPRFKEAETLEEIGALVADYKKTVGKPRASEIERRVLAALNHRQGRLLLEAGKYEQAAPLLVGGQADRDLYTDQAFALQTLGRFSDGFASVSGLVEMSEQEAMCRYLVRRGYMAFAEGQFQSAVDKFAAVETIGYSSFEDGPLTLIHYLSQLLAGKKADVPSEEWKGLSLPGATHSKSDASWPFSGSMFLQGMLTEAEVFTRIEMQQEGKESDLCEAHFIFSALCRAKGDAAGELKHLESALATQAYTNQCFSLATVRFRELSAAKK